MNSTQNSTNNVRVTEGEVQPQESGTPEGKRQKMERLKKPIIFGLMAVVFTGCMYLIFKPSDKKLVENLPGLNDAVPQASDAGMQSDKQKAYEEDQLAQAQQLKRNALTTLSDYWMQDEQEDKIDMQSDSEEPDDSSTSSPALKSYKNA